MKNYSRVIPRDLFNEAKLLKCMGQLCLKIHDGELHEYEPQVLHDGDPFKIELLDDGSLYILNIRINFFHSISAFFKTTQNSKLPYPFFLIDEEYVEYRVFNDDGSFHEDFLLFLKDVKTLKS